MPEFTATTTLPVDPAEALAWHARPGAFERLAPPWQSIRVLRRTGSPLDPGSQLEFRLSAGPLSMRWLAVHEPLPGGAGFLDRQVRGPFAHWEHRHTFAPADTDTCRMEDSIRWMLPLAPFGGLLAGPAVGRSLRRLFTFRHERTRRDLASHARAAHHAPGRAAITGASGLVGSALAAFLSTGGHDVRRLVRRAPALDGEVRWDPATGEVAAGGLDGVDVVYHLAGENIAAGRWTSSRRRALRSSRVDTTAALSERIAAMPAPPRVLVVASAIGVYGDRGDTVLDESSPPGEGYLPDLCREWEDATLPARRAGVRVVQARFGVVLAPSGGALGRLLPLFRYGLGGPIGTGRQWMSWISIDDAIAALHFMAHQESLHGAVNVTSPAPVTNREFARTLGAVLHRPALFRVPSMALRAAYGEMARETLLASARVHPTRLVGAGFSHSDLSLEGALRFVLGRAE